MGVGFQTFREDGTPSFRAERFYGRVVHVQSFTQTYDFRNYVVKIPGIRAKWVANRAAILRFTQIGVFEVEPETNDDLLIYAGWDTNIQVIEW